jgi:hypothetical protein
MKLSKILGLTVVALGIAACAVSPDDEGENTGSTKQALCPRGMDCFPTSSSGFSSGGVFDPGTSSSSGGTTTTFECKGKASLCSYMPPYDRYLDCNPQNPSQCVCVRCGSGGGWPFGSYNVCPPSRPNYACNQWGTCTCY